MSNVPQGPGWWQASDGKWYAAELAPSGFQQASSYGAQPTSGMGGGPGADPQKRGTNPAAVWALVLGCLCIVPYLSVFTFIPAIVVGLVARHQIKKGGNVQAGSGIALACVIMAIPLFFAGSAVAGSVQHTKANSTTTTQAVQVKTTSPSTTHAPATTRPPSTSTTTRLPATTTTTRPTPTTTIPPTTVPSTTIPPTTAPPGTTAPTVAAAATPPSCSPVAASGNCYEPGEFCSAADHGLSGTDGQGNPIACEDNNGWRWEPS